MRSSEVAKLVGVSVRTLRHYHSLGLLVEPERSANGYRNYTTADLARLLRIKRLASLGFPLARIGEILNDMDAASEEPSDDAAGSVTTAALDELDRELALQIENLKQQRQVIAQLKAERLSPDMPIRFARILQSLAQLKGSEELSSYSRTVLVLVGHLYSEGELDELERVIDVLQDASIMQALVKLDARCAALEPDAPVAKRDQFVEEALAVLTPLIAQFDVVNWTNEETERDRILDSATSEGLNPAQLDVIKHIEQAIEAMLVEPSTTRSQMN